MDITVQFRIRNYKKKNNRGETSSTTMKQAAEIVLLEGKTVRFVAKQFNVCHVSLHRLVKKTKGSLQLEISYSCRPRKCMTIYDLLLVSREALTKQTHQQRL